MLMLESLMVLDLRKGVIRFNNCLKKKLSPHCFQGKKNISVIWVLWKGHLTQYKHTSAF